MIIIRFFLEPVVPHRKYQLSSNNKLRITTSNVFNEIETSGPFGELSESVVSVFKGSLE